MSPSQLEEMGIPLSLALDPRDIPVRSSNSQKTVKPFPPTKQGVAGDLLTEFSAYPSTLGHPIDENQPYWWVDCQFVPFDNSQLIVTAGAYILRPSLSWVTCKGVRAGLITHWLIGQDKLSCGVLKGTSTTSRPKVQIHPDGKYMGFVGRGCVRIVDKLNNDRYIKNDAVRSVSYKYCAFSPDGVYIAVLFRVQCSFELEINRLDVRLLKVNGVICHNLCPLFKGTRSYTEQVECMFSPDSTLVALSHSDGVLLTLFQHNLSLHCQVFPGVVSDVYLSNERSYDFDPTSGHKILSAGGNNGQLFTIDVDDGEVLFEEEIHASETIDCVQYSRSGDCLAVATADFCITLLSPQTRQVMLKLSGREKCPSITIQPCTGRLPAVIRMSFDHCGEHMAVSSTDGQVRIWQLARRLDLRYLCKLKIEQHCSVKDMRRLPLPTRVITYLLSPGCL